MMTTAPPSADIRSAVGGGGAVRSGAFAPLTVGAFRMLWLAGLASNVGSWMQSVGAQWSLVEGGSSPAVVALVQSAAAAPVLLLAIPAGVIGEFLDRRRILIAAQAVQFAVAAALTVLAATGQLGAASLIALTFALGAASAVQLPAYQALTADVVPTPMLGDAASLVSISVNIARAVGPAAAGLVVAQLGVPAVFAVNALSFALFLVVLVCWRGYRRPASHPEPFLDASRAGLRYVRHAGVVRTICLRLAIFLLPAVALWALLPVLAQQSLGLGAAGYGLLLAALGAGSIAGALVLPVVRAKIGVNIVVSTCAVLFGAAIAALAVTPSLWIALELLVAAGFGWIGVIATIGGVIQAFLPAWVRTRGLSIYQLVLLGGTAIGSAVDGALASVFGVTEVLLAAGLIVSLVGLAQFARPLPRTEGMGRRSVPLEDASPVAVADDDERRVLVLVRYQVEASHREEFRRAMAAVAQTRYRTGARDWHLYEAAEDPVTIIEAYELGSWREHVAQVRIRHTEWDAANLARAKGLSIRPPTVEHCLGLPVPRLHPGGPRRGEEHDPTG
ncbi:MFS transporter [Microbacterium ureisolvens]|uniref:MFS transporter n=1 Tax=Microbacterium ureisolvens TaxID=2781186 RepID=A0ABS7I1R9_9MICO|nr:MFS transporter [Microbacterium ureisolvens]MBW9110700.1 MFS transporter [Microbacterium ureisolvens]